MSKLIEKISTYLHASYADLVNKFGYDAQILKDRGYEWFYNEVESIRADYRDKYSDEDKIAFVDMNANPYLLSLLEDNHELVQDYLEDIFYRLEDRDLFERYIGA